MKNLKKIRGNKLLDDIGLIGSSGLGHMEIIPTNDG